MDWIADWPGRSPREPGGIPHPPVHHMLDVAAAPKFAWSHPLCPPRRQAKVLLTALHDLGKIGAAFRDCLLRGTPQINGTHWKVTEALLRLHDAQLNERLRIARPN